MDHAINFDNLKFEFLMDYERVREEWYSYSAKHELIHELIREFIKKGDMESDTYKLLDDKRHFISNRVDTLYDIQKYLGNLKDDMPFNVRRTVGRYMVKYGLTKEQSELFLSVHKSHMDAMGTDNQKKYKLPYVQNVVWDQKEDCIKVYYEDVWWHYTKKHEWY